VRYAYVTGLRVEEKQTHLLELYTQATYGRPHIVTRLGKVSVSVLLIITRPFIFLNPKDLEKSQSSRRLFYAQVPNMLLTLKSCLKM
jgi:hypothetical protein